MPVFGLLFLFFVVIVYFLCVLWQIVYLLSVRKPKVGNFLPTMVQMKLLNVLIAINTENENQKSTISCRLWQTKYRLFNSLTL